MMSLQEVSDRLEIQDLFARYSFAIDDRDFDALDDIFTPDAWIDYTAVGGAAGPYPEIKAWLQTSLAMFDTGQHLVATTKLSLDGDTATSRTILFNPMIMKGQEAGNRQGMFIGVWYRDTLVRTDAGWRIAERSQDSCYAFTAPLMG